MMLKGFVYEKLVQCCFCGYEAELWAKLTDEGTVYKVIDGYEVLERCPGCQATWDAAFLSNLGAHALREAGRVDPETLRIDRLAREAYRLGSTEEEAAFREYLVRAAFRGLGPEQLFREVTFAVKEFGENVPARVRTRVRKEILEEKVKEYADAVGQIDLPDELIERMPRVVSTMASKKEIVVLANRAVDRAVEQGMDAKTAAFAVYAFLQELWQRIDRTLASFPFTQEDFMTRISEHLKRRGYACNLTH